MIIEWPHSAALGEKWFVYPPSGAPAGLRVFTCRDDAEAHDRELIEQYGDSDE